MNIDFQDKKVLIRVDFNVPLDANHQITDDSRIRAALPTLQYILDHGGSCIILSHRGRPQKKKKEDGSIDVEKFTLKYLIPRISKLLGQEVQFGGILEREATSSQAEKLRPGEILLLENTRFEPGEKKGDSDFSQWLASLADVYVNDAFGTAHRAHASTATVAQYFRRDQKCLGFLIDKELMQANRLLGNPEHPFVAIIGGAKVSDKILLLKRLIGNVDHILIGGGMTYTFIKAQGGSIGNSLCENDRLELAKELLKEAEIHGTTIHLPEDSVLGDQFAQNAKVDLSSSYQIPDQWMGLDIGPRAIDKYSGLIREAKTIFWNGPMGVFEFEAFSNGTKAIAEAVAQSTDQGAYSLIGGGDSVAAINSFNLGNRVSFMSTGGGAMLKLLEGSELPGIAAVKN